MEAKSITEIWLLKQLECHSVSNAYCWLSYFSMCMSCNIKQKLIVYSLQENAELRQQQCEAEEKGRRADDRQKADAYKQVCCCCLGIKWHGCVRGSGTLTEGIALRGASLPGAGLLIHVGACVFQKLSFKFIPELASISSQLFWKALMAVVTGWQCCLSAAEAPAGSR